MKTSYLHIHQAHCISTNQLAHFLLRSNSYKPSVIQQPLLITAVYQHKGKGMGQNTWLSPAGKNLLFSWVMQPVALQAQQIFSLNMLSILALHQTVAAHVNPSCLFVKWPNDLLYVHKKGHKKLAGMLIESRMSAQLTELIIGIGLNVNQVKHLPPSATSLQQITRRACSLTDLREGWIENFMQKYEELKKENGQESEQKIKQEYLSKLYQLNVWRKYACKGKECMGKITDVHANGQVVLQTARGMQRFMTKELVYLT